MTLHATIPLALATIFSGFVPSTSHADGFVIRHEYVLGTSLELRIDTNSAEVAGQAEQLALSEIDRLTAILSRHDESSELMRWQRGEIDAAELSAELPEVLRQADLWWRRTGGALDVRIGALSSLWAEAGEQDRLPAAKQRQAIISRLAEGGWRTADGGQIVRKDSLPISLDALAKGYILDSVCEVVASRFPEITGISLNIGGDIRKRGGGPLTVSIVDPDNSSEGADPLLTFSLRADRAIATSGGYRRYFEIKGRRYSHVIDPRSGFPAGNVLSATVLAPAAVDADAAATALCVLPFGSVAQPPKTTKNLRQMTYGKAKNRREQLGSVPRSVIVRRRQMMTWNVPRRFA